MLFILDSGARDIILTHLNKCVKYSKSIDEHTEKIHRDDAIRVMCGEMDVIWYLIQKYQDLNDPLLVECVYNDYRVISKYLETMANGVTLTKMNILNNSLNNLINNLKQ